MTRTAQKKMQKIPLTAARRTARQYNSRAPGTEVVSKTVVMRFILIGFGSIRKSRTFAAANPAPMSPPRYRNNSCRKISFIDRPEIAFHFGKVPFEKRDSSVSHIIAIIHPHKNALHCKACQVQPQQFQTGIDCETAISMHWCTQMIRFDDGGNCIDQKCRTHNGLTNSLTTVTLNLRCQIKAFRSTQSQQHQ